MSVSEKQTCNVKEPDCQNWTWSQSVNQPQVRFVLVSFQVAPVDVGERGCDVTTVCFCTTYVCCHAARHTVAWQHTAIRIIPVRRHRLRSSTRETFFFSFSFFYLLWSKTLCFSYCHGDVNQKRSNEGKSRDDKQEACSGNFRWIACMTPSRCQQYGFIG